MQAKFYICPHCGNLIGMIHTSGVPVVCCGEKMKELVPNTTEAAGEKHLPIVFAEEGAVHVNVGAVNHPMTEEHLIQWIYLETKNGGRRKILHPTDAPEVTFAVGEDTPIAVYAYCNLHGLWMTEIV